MCVCVCVCEPTPTPVHVCVCVCVCPCTTTINCQSAGDPPPLSSSDRIPQVLGFVFQTAVGGEEKQTSRHFPNLCVFLRHFFVQEKNRFSVIIFVDCFICIRDRFKKKKNLCCRVARGDSSAALFSFCSSPLGTESLLV